MSSSRMRADKVLNVMGLHCPEPVFRTRIELDRMAPGEVLEVVADDPGTKEDIERMVNRLGHEIISIECKEEKVRFLIKKR